MKIEKIEIKKYKTFPSREYGEGGGSCCDLYINGKNAGTFFQEGNGGCCDLQINEYTEKEINEFCINFFCENEIRKSWVYNDFNSNIDMDTFLKCIDIEVYIEYIQEIKELKKALKKSIKDFNAKGIFNTNPYINILRNFYQSAWIISTVKRDKEYLLNVYPNGWYKNEKINNYSFTLKDLDIMLGVKK